MTPEIVYLGHDNSNDLILKADGVEVSLSGVTSMTLTIGTKKISSTNQLTDPILWTKSGYSKGEVHLLLGHQSFVPKNYRTCPLVIYDSSYEDGLVWGNIHLDVRAEVEGTT